jgi:PAS domain S-box-containing protein
VFDDSGHFQGLRCFSRDNTEVRVAQDLTKELQGKLGVLEKQIHEILEKHMKEDHVPIPSFDITIGQECDYMFLFDEDAKIMDCTNDIQNKLGYNKQEMLTLTLSDVSCLESHEAIKANLMEAKKQGTMHVKTIHKKKDGTSVLVSEHIRYLKDRNIFICMVKEDLL